MKFLFPLILVWTWSTFVPTTYALTLTAASDQTKFNKLSTALASPSGKLTLSPELVVPEPKDATSILLLTNAVQTLSERIRLCKSNVAFIRGSITALQTFTNEQSASRGNFPGPVPSVYCYGSTGNSKSTIEKVLSDIASAGADGVLIELQLICPNDGKLLMIDSLISGISEDWMEIWHATICAGLQPIPEILIGEELSLLLGEIEMDQLIGSFINKVAIEPVAIVITISPTRTFNDNEKQDVSYSIPQISRSLSKKLPILGSVRAESDGENRLLYEETIRFKEAGYRGTFLRWNCVPGYQLQPSLDFVGQFWFACISDLKSTRSKAFSFRSKNNLDVSAATKWGNYQRRVIESGALGDPNESSSINEDNGDYQAF